MPFNGSGGFTRLMNWVNDATSGIKIRADRHDQEDDNFAAGLSQCITKDGQTTVTAHIPFNAKRLTGVGDPVNDQDAVTKKWVADNVVGGALIADAPPAAAKVGNLWWDSDEGNLYLKYDDGTSVQFVQINSGAPQYTDQIRSVAQDMWAGFETGGQFAINDKVDGSGNDLLTVADNGWSIFNGSTVRLAGRAGDTQISMQLMKPSGAAGIYAGIMGLTAGNLRWLVQLGTSNAESGANAGSDFAISRYNDAGSSLSTPFQISRQAGGIIQASARISDNALGANPTWHAQAGDLIVDYAGPANNNGAVFSNRNTSPTSTSHILFMWVSGPAGSITSNSAGATQFNTSSDARLKEGVEPVTDARSLVDALQVVEYTPVPPMKSLTVEYQGEVDGVTPGPQTHMGIPAQQAYQVFPTAVTPPDIDMPGYRADLGPGDEGFMPWMIDYSKFVPMLIANMQDANRLIDELQARIAVLEGAS